MLGEDYLYKSFFCDGKEEQMQHYANKKPKDNAALRKNALSIAISYGKYIFFAFFFQLHPTRPPGPVHSRMRCIPTYQQL